MNEQWNIAIVGATGAVGNQVIECLVERDFPVDSIKFLGSARNAGEVLEFSGKPVMVEELESDSFDGVDIAFFSAGGDCSREFCPVAVRAGAVCIDMSGAWGMDQDVPLVVPEVNPHALGGYSRKGIVANPGCPAIQTAVALKPLHDYAKIRRIVISTYQAVSNSGQEAVEELQKQIVEMINGRPSKSAVYPHRIAFNCIPHVTLFEDNGYTREETKVAEETGKILEAVIGVTATAVCIPVFYGDCGSINIETERKITAARARELLKKAPGIKVMDDPAKNAYPMPANAAGQDLVFVGRIREDGSVENGLNLWVVADNIRKGAATNAVQIAEMLVREYL